MKRREEVQILIHELQKRKMVDDTTDELELAIKEGLKHIRQEKFSRKHNKKRR